ncbi:GGDEF domain-containing protein [Salinisphaera sp. T31B1]|uniref:GGDEF domain-containing protein n=1 Tax=Salinisphaera sp. T31B1 TaxID=727963 RepID=UPI00333F4132
MNNVRRPTTAHAAFWVMTRRVTLLAASVDIGFFVFFLWADSPLLAWMNVLSVAMYIGAYRLLVARRNRLALALIWFEVIGHAVVGTLLVGWDAGFNYYLLMFIPAIMVSGSRRAVIGPLVVLFGLYVILHAVARHYGPLDPLFEPALWLLSLFNMSIFFAMASYTARYYYGLVQRSERRLRDMATRDTLTGLFNRRHLSEVAATQLALGTERAVRTSLVIADIDGFKHINDRWGHDAGDRVLSGVSALFLEHCPPPYTASRWGGEEFLFLLPDADTAAACGFAERLRKTIADARIPLPDGTVACTISLGVATLEAPESLEAAIGRADRALYRSKSAGRDRVTVAGPPKDGADSGVKKGAAGLARAEPLAPGIPAVVQSARRPL